MSAPGIDELYRDSRRRVEALARAAADLTVPVPACPGWSARDLLGHLVGCAEDFAADATPDGGPTSEWTDGHIARHADDELDALFAAWEAAAADLEPMLAEAPFSPCVLDVLAHEHDLRNALRQPGDRADEGVRWGAAMVLQFFRPPVPVVVRTEDGGHRAGPEDSDGEPLELDCSRYEVFRWRLGRRSRAQIASLDWTGDPTPYLDDLVLMGPADRDVVE